MIRTLVTLLRTTPLSVLSLLSILTVALMVCCSEYDTDSAGSKFVPVNSQVRAFTHLVYVEYSQDEVRVWGPCKDQVEAQIDAQHVRLRVNADSLVFIAYGFPAKANIDSDQSLTIVSDQSYALYLSGLALVHHQGPVISCLGKGTCYMVLTEKSNNELYSYRLDQSVQGDGCIYTEGQLILGGTGKLFVANYTDPDRGSCGHAISTGSLLCQYNVNVTLDSWSGDGIYARQSVRSSLGTWDITAYRHGINAGDSIVLFAGTYTGSAAQGSYLLSDVGAAVRMPKLTAASGWASDVMDSLSNAQLFDSVQAVWQDQFLDIVFEADSSYQIADTAGAKITKIQCKQSVESPFVLISDGKVLSDAELHIEEVK